MFFLIAFTIFFFSQLFLCLRWRCLVRDGFIKITSHGIEQAGIIFCRLCWLSFFNLAYFDDHATKFGNSSWNPCLTFLKDSRFLFMKFWLIFVYEFAICTNLDGWYDSHYECSKARGVDFGEGNIIQKVKAMDSYFDSFIRHEFERADSLLQPWKLEGIKAGMDVVSIDSWNGWIKIV